MNIQDIADFIDLVKNPAKYEKVLQNIKDEQGRLNAVIATVAEASELGALRKEVETKAANLDSAYAEKAKKLEQEYTRKLKKVDTLQAEVGAQLLQAQAEIESAVSKQRAADELANSFSGRDKKLKEQEALVASLREELKASVAEYNIKIEKLRSVMG